MKRLWQRLFGPKRDAYGHVLGAINEDGNYYGEGPNGPYIVIGAREIVEAQSRHAEARAERAPKQASHLEQFGQDRLSLPGL